MHDNSHLSTPSFTHEFRSTCFQVSLGRSGLPCLRPCFSRHALRIYGTQRSRYSLRSSGGECPIFPTRTTQYTVPTSNQARLNCALHSSSPQPTSLDCALHTSNQQHISLAARIVQCTIPAESPSVLRITTM